MEVPELNLRECDSVFVRDEFYENIQAPKFHDFCSNEDPLVDADAYFRRLGGRSPRPSTDPFSDQNAFRGTKEATVLKPPGLPKAPLCSMTLNTDVTSSVPKASSAGLRKAKPALPMLATPLTKSQDKAPSKNKMYSRVSPVSNASLSFPASDGKGNDSVQAPATVKSCHSSENTDPNGTYQARRKVTNSGGSKLDEGSLRSATLGPASVQTPIHTESDSKVASEAPLLVKSQSQVPKPLKDKSEGMAGRVADPAIVVLSDMKDRKRKPTSRNAEAGVTKVYETRARVLKQQRKSSTFSDSDGCLGSSDLGPSSCQRAKTSCSEPVRATTAKPPSDKGTHRNSSDRSRRRRASGGLNARQARRALVTGPKSNANGEQESTGNFAAQLSLSSPIQFGSNVTNKHLPATEEQNSVINGVVIPESTSIPGFVSPGPMVTSDSHIDCTEVSCAADECSLNPRSGRASNSEPFSGFGEPARESVQTLPSSPDKSVISQQVVQDSVDDHLLQKLQTLKLQQEDSQAVKALEPNNAREAPRPVFCVTFSDDKSVVEEVNDHSWGQTDFCKEYTEELTAGGNLNTIGAGVSTSTVLNLGEAESGLDSADEFPMSKVVPGEAQGEHDTIDSFRSQDIDLVIDGLESNMNQATTVPGECMVTELDQANVIESLQNLQIQPKGTGRVGSELPCHQDAGGAIFDDSSLGVRKEHSGKVRGAGNGDDMLPKSHSRVSPVECKITTGTQQVKTGNEAKSLKRLVSKGPSREAHDIESDLRSSKGSQFYTNNQQKRNNKRKSIELGPHRNEQRSMTTSSALSVDEQRKAKVTSQSSLAPLTHSQLSSSVSKVAVPSGISGQHKKMKTTCPQPFRLRTEERGALKEVEFNKKVELYLAAKEKMLNVPFQFTTNKDSRALNQNTVKPPRNIKTSVTSMKQIHQHTEARAAERALFDMKVTEKSVRADEDKQEREKRLQLEAEEEIKRMRKQLIPHAQRMPFFDRPFKPHRSTKTLTVPSSPKFHSLRKKSSARTSTQE